MKDVMWDVREGKMRRAYHEVIQWEESKSESLWIVEHTPVMRLVNAAIQVPIWIRINSAFLGVF